jgi:hypothetical protein
MPIAMDVTGGIEAQIEAESEEPDLSRTLICPLMRGRHGLVDFEERMVTKELKEVERADGGQQLGSSLTRSCAASAQRVPLLLQLLGGGSRDALSIVGATRHGHKCEPRRRWRRGAISLERLKDC